MPRCIRCFLPGVLFVGMLGFSSVFAQSRALIGSPGTGELVVGVRLVEADRFHRQGYRVDGPLERKTASSWNVTFVPADMLALHVGTAWSEFFAASGGSPTGDRDRHRGRGDTTLGLTWRLTDRRDGVAVAVRIGGRVPGPYDSGYTNSLGDGAAELQGSLVVERFGAGFGWTLESGYRQRASAFVNPAGIGRPSVHYEKVDVPNDVFLFAGGY